MPMVPSYHLVGCRELIRQVDAGNWSTSVIVAENTVVKLAELLPFATPAKEPEFFSNVLVSDLACLNLSQLGTAPGAPASLL